MEFNREPDGGLAPLPEKNIDTGMGFERTLAVLEGVNSDYETGLFVPIIKSIEEIAGVPLSEDNNVSFQVIADHVRCLIFAITDGVLPSNEGRGYVLRRILRRAVRHGRLLGLHTPFLHRLVDAVVDLMADGYKELGERRETVEAVIGSEEELFFRTLDRGLEEFDRVAKRLIEDGKTILPGDEAFKLHDTYGFPLDLTRIMAEERGLAVDRHGFENAMEAQRERAKRGAKVQAAMNGTDAEDWTFFREEHDTIFTGYENLLQPEMRMIKYRQGNGGIMLVFDRTPFYGEAGGQVGDTGFIEGRDATIRVDDVLRSGGQFIHIGEIERGRIEDIEYTGRVDEERRRRIMANHTATHLLHYALREVVGTHAAQAGSMVAAERLRFDFNHYQPLTDKQIERLEDLVNSAVLSNIEVQVAEVSMEEAKAKGATMLFDEKYGDRVRVVQIGDLSTELCGGTHTARTGDIGLFRIIREGSISSGIRRIEAVTRFDSYNLQKQNEKILEELAGIVGSDGDGLAARVRALKDELAVLKRELKRERQRDVENKFDPQKDFVQIDGCQFAHMELAGSSPDEMRRVSDQIRTGPGSKVVVITGVKDGKVHVVLSASEEAVQSGIHAGRLLGSALAALGGKGGGRPHMAQGGGVGEDDIAKLVSEVREKLKQC
jgi:alanyl-tRNA synthetase